MVVGRRKVARYRRQINFLSKMMYSIVLHYITVSQLLIENYNINWLGNSYIKSVVYS